MFAEVGKIAMGTCFISSTALSATNFISNERIQKCELNLTTLSFINTKQRLRRPLLTIRMKDEKQDTNETKPEEEGQTKTEKLAALIGQDSTTMKKKQEEVFEERELSNREKYTNLAVSTFIAVSLFLVEKLNPSTGANILKVLQQSSLSPEVIGTNGVPTLVEFSALWCQSCKDMSKNIFDLENSYGGRVNFVVINCEDPDNSNFIQNFGVDGIPQFSFLDKDGNNLTNFVGYVPSDVLRENLEALIKDERLPHSGISVAGLKEAFNFE